MKRGGQGGRQGGGRPGGRGQGKGPSGSGFSGGNRTGGERSGGHGQGGQGGRGGQGGQVGKAGGGTWGAPGGRPGWNPPAKGKGPQGGKSAAGPGWGAAPAARGGAPFRSGKPAFGKGRPGGRPAGPAPSKVELGKLMARYGVKLPQHTLDQLWIYHQFLRENNKDLDLTRLIGFETMAQRHYADCMILHGIMQGRWPSPLVDVGSGAGFPGLMIKLMSPKTRLVLAEPRPRRVDFLQRAIKELKLKDITVFPHKVTSRSFTEPMAGSITRAFETVEKTLPRLGGCLGLGSLAIFMKGPKVAEELTELRNDEYKVLRNHVYRIPNTTLDRALLVMERIKVPAQPDSGAEVAEDEEMADWEAEEANGGSRAASADVADAEGDEDGGEGDGDGFREDASEEEPS